MLASSPLLLVLLVDFLEVGVDDVVLLGLAGSAGAALTAVATAAAFIGSL
jgi:hypothetical protein